MKSEEGPLRRHIGTAREQSLDWLSTGQWRYLRYTASQKEMVQRGLDDVAQPMHNGESTHAGHVAHFNHPYYAVFSGDSHRVELGATRRGNSEYTLLRTDLPDDALHKRIYHPDAFHFFSDPLQLMAFQRLPADIPLEDPFEVTKILHPDFVQDTPLNRLRGLIMPESTFPTRASWTSQHRLELEVCRDPGKTYERVTTYRLFPQPDGSTIFAAQPHGPQPSKPAFVPTEEPAVALRSAPLIA